MENTETWDTGEVRLHLNNDENLYHASHRELEVVDYHTEAYHLRLLWDEHGLNSTVDPDRVDWILLAGEIEDNDDDPDPNEVDDYSADELASNIYVAISNELLRAGDVGTLMGALSIIAEVAQLDVTSSASCQHYIDTGRYLRDGEVQD